jgi:hypothetical protein
MGLDELEYPYYRTHPAFKLCDLVARELNIIAPCLSTEQHSLASITEGLVTLLRAEVRYSH